MEFPSDGWLFLEALEPLIWMSAVFAAAVILYWLVTR